MSVDETGEPSLFDVRGRRKYLTGTEGVRFEAVASERDARTSAFCLLVSYTGCRISEALALTRDRLDPECGCAIFKTLKRRRLSFRAVPIPQFLMADLLALPETPDGRLWPWCRQTGWRRIKDVLRAAGIEGAHAMPKGLRHRFGVRALQANIPPSLAQRWMGHANLKSTALYQQALGDEERRMARRLWEVAD